MSMSTNNNTQQSLSVLYPKKAISNELSKHHVEITLNIKYKVMQEQ